MAKCMSVSILLGLLVMTIIVNGTEAAGRGFVNYPLDVEGSDVNPKDYVDPKDYCSLCNAIMPWMCYSCPHNSPTSSPTIQ
ncbi:hypothetical protein TSUD_354960 [Trifolium subterraneum]|uniref:Uncharacterized protein n=1 Tax=Trifolium subterraneum TaxID=3900 RepID=A0A2Z6N3V8_TRISU|nr:hypothetical protein TSUD_354960 [Trifolium subterraneum]